MNVARFMRFLLLTLCWVSSTVQAGSEDDLWLQLQKSATAARELSYKGLFVCQTGAQTKSVQITHIFDGKNEFARNILLDGTPREMLNHGNNLIIYNAKHEKIIIEKRRGQNMFPAVLPLNLDDVKESYRLQSGAQELVAGRQAQILMLEPKDSLRFRFKFWVDAEYGLLLKSAILNQRGETMESIAFNQLVMLDKVDMDWFRPQIDKNKSYVMEETPKVVADNKVSDEWEVKALPSGYHKVDQMLRTVRGKAYPVTHVIFSDGLASVSLFIEPVMQADKIRQLSKPMLSSHGSTSFYTNVNNGRLVTVVGEVPEATVVQIGNAVIFKK